MSKDGLVINSVLDLSPRYEAFSEEDDDHGNPIFLYSSFGLITPDCVAYFGQSKLRKSELTPEDIKQSLKRLPDDDVFPKAPHDIVVANYSSSLSSKIYVKRPKLHTSFIGTGQLPKLLLQEARIMEYLSHNFHPHLARYHGSLVKRDRLVGLALDRYPLTLQHRLTKKCGQYFDTENCMTKLTSAVRHLNSLGLAHNDLTPMNIMVNDQDDPIIIDFGSCRSYGETLITAGTPGWIDGDFTTSAPEHDEIALKKIAVWLDDIAGGFPCS